MLCSFLLLFWFYLYFSFFLCFPIQKKKYNKPSSYAPPAIRLKKRQWSDRDTQMYRDGYPVSGPSRLSAVTWLMIANCRQLDYLTACSISCTGYKLFAWVKAITVKYSSVLADSDTVIVDRCNFCKTFSW